MKAVITGARGHMGRELQTLWAEKYPEDVLVLLNREDNDTLAEKLDGVDCLVDFSGPGALGPILEYGRRTGTPLVLATTGYDEGQMKAMIEAAGEIPLFYSANMSLGVYVLKQLARQAAAYLGDADIEIVEKHHNRKKDAPSGTARLLADAMEEVRGERGRCYGREGLSPRVPGEIGIHALRAGTITGEHTILFGLENETLEITHRGESRRLFAAGAMKAARFLQGRTPGFYNMDDMMDRRNEQE